MLYSEFLTVVKECRTAQNNFFKLRKDPRSTPSQIKSALEYAKQCESILDKSIAELDSSKDAQILQSKLF